jgi:hypothetical protein
VAAVLSAVAAFFLIRKQGYCSLMVLFRNLGLLDGQAHPYLKSSNGKNWVIFFSRLLVQAKIENVTYGHREDFWKH